MLSIEQVESLGLGISPITAKTCLLVESGLVWVAKNTNIKIKLTDEGLQELSAGVRLFVVKYIEIMSLRAGISSESISNLSQSFTSVDVSAMLWDVARELIGDELNSGLQVFNAVNKWT